MHSRGVDFISRIVQVLTTRSLALHYVVTPYWYLNWCEPVYGLKRVVNAVVTRIFGLNK